MALTSVWFPNDPLRSTRAAMALSAEHYAPGTASYLSSPHRNSPWLRLFRFWKYEQEDTVLHFGFNFALIDLA
jgi:hypothetical protein